jgi:hypothetical protein
MIYVQVKHHQTTTLKLMWYSGIEPMILSFKAQIVLPVWHSDRASYLYGTVTEHLYGTVTEHLYCLAMGFNYNVDPKYVTALHTRD